SAARSTPPTSGSPATREPRIPGAAPGRRRRGCPPRGPRAARPARPGALGGQVEPPRRARESRRDDARGGGARGCRGVRPRDPCGGRRRHRGAHRARRGGPHPLSLRPRGLPRVSGVHAPRAGQRRRRRAVDRGRPGRRAGHDRGAPGHGPAGPRAETTLEVLRRGAAAALRRARDLGARTVAAEVLGDRLPAPQRAQALVEGALLGTYTFDRYKKEKPERAVEELRIVDAEAGHGREIEEGARRGEVFARATVYARDLINAPANELSPSDLARAP